MKITAYNPSTDNTEKSFLASSYAAGVTSIVVRNNNLFPNNSPILIGAMGRESSEIVTTGTVNADGITVPVSATKFPHSADDPVFVLNYDQMKFYRSTTTVSGSYSLLATVALDVDNFEKVTRYEDSTGLSSYFYKTSFYNSVTATESALSDGILGSSYTRSQVGYIINDFLIEVGDIEQQYMNVTQAISVMNECNDDLSTQSKRPYRFLRKKQTLTITAGSDRISLPTDLMRFDRAKYNYAFGSTSRTDNIDVIDIEEMEYLKYDNLATTSDELSRIAIDETTNEIVLYPTPTTTQTDKITVYYWKKFADFDSLGDAIETANPRVYKLFLSARLYRMRGLHDESFLPLSDRYASDYATEIVKMQRANRLDIGTPMGMRPDLRVARGLRKS